MEGKTMNKIRKNLRGLKKISGDTKRKVVAILASLDYFYKKKDVATLHFNKIMPSVTHHRYTISVGRGQRCEASPTPFTTRFASY
jgi:hypothetical protein